MLRSNPEFLVLIYTRTSHVFRVYCIAASYVLFLCMVMFFRFIFMCDVGEEVEAESSSERSMNLYQSIRRQMPVFFIVLLPSYGTGSCSFLSMCIKTATGEDVRPLTGR